VPGLIAAPAGGRILRLFGMMERLGMHAEIPEVTWDVGGRAGIVLISNQDCAALFLGIFYFLFFFLTKTQLWNELLVGCREAIYQLLL
jgi:hypothetical protein